MFYRTQLCLQRNKLLFLCMTKIFCLNNRTQMFFYDNLYMYVHKSCLEIVNISSYSFEIQVPFLSVIFLLYFIIYYDITCQLLLFNDYLNSPSKMEGFLEINFKCSLVFFCVFILNFVLLSPSTAKCVLIHGENTNE